MVAIPLSGESCQKQTATVLSQELLLPHQEKWKGEKVKVVEYLTWPFFLGPARPFLDPRYQAIQNSKISPNQSHGSKPTQDPLIQCGLLDGMYHQGLWLNDKIAVVGTSRINRLLQKKTNGKPMKLSKAKVDLKEATPKPFEARPPAAFNPKPHTPKRSECISPSYDTCDSRNLNTSPRSSNTSS